MSIASPSDDGNSSDYDEYRKTRYFAALDGVRGVSILLVVLAHTPVLSRIFTGYLGVQIFFVLSGYLITMLALREEADRGTISLAGFYVRRAARILPLYYLALGAFVFAMVGLHQLQEARQPVAPALPYYLTYMNDIAPRTAFAHSWSLGVEEKFYLAWPVVGFVLMRAARLSRRAMVTGSAALGLLLAPLVGLQVFGGYGAILVGCLLAIGLHSRLMFNRLARATRSWWVGLGLAALVALHVLIGFVGEGAVDGYGHAIDHGERLIFYVLLRAAYPWACAAILGLTVLRPGALSSVLRTPALVSVGTLAYGIYLFHPLVGAVVFRLLPDWFEHGVVTIIPFLLIAGASIVVASVLRRCIERPCIAAGRRISARLGAGAATGHQGAMPAQ